MRGISDSYGVIWLPQQLYGREAVNILGLEYCHLYDSMYLTADPLDEMMLEITSGCPTEGQVAPDLRIECRSMAHQQEAESH